MMRIITGKARGTRLATLEGEATRPTAERTKEAVFSMLCDRIPESRVLDLFAGSGQLGLEALSRGASHAVFCDSSARALDVVRANAEKTHLMGESELLRTDAVSFLRSAKGKRQFDIVFLDPPYAMGLVPVCLSLLRECSLLSPEARLICETADAADVFGKETILQEHFEILRVARYGAACVTVLRQKEITE